jgi:hypothetical protein
LRDGAALFPLGAGLPGKPPERAHAHLLTLEHRADFMKRHDVHDALFYFLFFRATAP